MVGLKSACVDANSKPIYSGQRLKLKDETPGELNLSFPVSWDKHVGFRFRGMYPMQYNMDKYVICDDISWLSKITPKWLK